MNNSDKHIDSWSMTDVQKYLRGELSARERHDLEKLSLDDPFLADALEGLLTYPAASETEARQPATPGAQQPAALDRDLAELRARLDARVATTRKTNLFPLLRVAAVLILLVGLGLTTYFGLLTTKHKASAPATPAANASAAATATTPPDTASEGKSTAPAWKTAPASAALRSTPPALYQTIVPARSEHLIRSSVANPPARNEETFASDSIIYNIDSSKSIAADLDVKKDTVTYNSQVFNVQRFGSLGNRAPAASNLISYSGRVLDFNNHPLAGASLSFKNNGAGAVTDQKGYFNLYLPQQDTTRHLTVALVGFEQADYALNTEDRTGNTIYLRQNPTSLQEVVVSGLGDKRREVLAAPPSDEPEVLDSDWLNTAPVIGRNTYLGYLDSAKKKMSVDTTIHGIESISFRVDKKGTLTEFKIERSLSPAHDAGVIRLINEGPAWRMLRGKSARALVNVAFP
jgi:hypothetical protein